MSCPQELLSPPRHLGRKRWEKLHLLYRMGSHEQSWSLMYGVEELLRLACDENGLNPTEANCRGVSWSAELRTALLV